MEQFLRKRSMFTLLSLVLGVALLINLVKLAVMINGEFIAYPYMITMSGAIFAALIGYLRRDPKALGISSVLWIISLAFNLAAFIFLIPIGLLNIIGRNKLLSKMEEAEEEKKQVKNIDDKF